MGFMDKAKKMAEQAQAKLDEAQKQFNSNQASGGGQGGGPAAQYDKHGRPVESDTPTPDPGAPASATPGEPGPAVPPPATPGVPPTDTPSAPAQTGPTPDPGAPATPGSPAPTEDRNRPSTEAPQVTHGDPLAG
jgi:hypothetical protein